MDESVVVFKNQDVEFGQWIREHRDGLVVNVPNLMLHRTDCSHIEDLMTKAPKACAAAPAADAALRRWASDVKGKRLITCEGCET
jgi:hypothetical protein